MERRFVVFLVLTLLLWTGFIALRMYVFPPPPRPVAQQKQKDEEPAAKQDEAEKTPEGDAKKETKPAEVEPVKPEIKAPATPAVPRQRLTLGSLDLASPYRLLVTIDNRGATVERVELNQLNGKPCKSVEDYTGYLGHLALTDALGGGAEVNVVGAGTPAALAKATGDVQGGLAVGDVIQAIDGRPMSDAVSVTEHLRLKTRPGQSVALTVVRKVTAQPIAFTALLTRRPMEVVQPESHTYKTPKGGLQFLPEDPLSLRLTLDNVGGRALRAAEKEIAGLPSLYDSNWKVEQQGEDFVELSITVDESALAKIDKAGSLKIVKRYELAKAAKASDQAYHLNLQVSIHNLGGERLSVAYCLDGPTGLPLEGWWYSTKLNPTWAGAGARDIVYEQRGSGHQLMGCPKIVADSKQAMKDNNLKDGQPPPIEILKGEQAAAFPYVGVDTQFFAGVVQPQSMANNQPIKFRMVHALAVQDVSLIPKTRLRTADVSFRLTTSSATIEPGAALTHEYRVFFGPKDPNLLNDYGLDRLIEYGWPIFKYPAIWLRSVLNGLYWLTGVIGLPNYGIAVILLTVIVRSGMIPVSLKQARSAAKMQELAPEIQKIKDKFPDDAMKQHAAVQELYKKHDFNMFGGCLPVFIQLPIFIGLYRCLSVDIDLRDAALLPGIAWASNLAGPDKLFRWFEWMPAFIADDADGWLGPFFNVFPLITVTLFLIQQKMFTPPATDEQTRMQQQMMTYMTVFMGVMFYKVPAGLCIYFITSSLWGICERKLLPKAKPKNEGGSGSAAKLPAKPASPNGSTRQTASARSKQKR